MSSVQFLVLMSLAAPGPAYRMEVTLNSNRPSKSPFFGTPNSCTIRSANVSSPHFGSISAQSE